MNYIFNLCFKLKQNFLQKYSSQCYQHSAQIPNKLINRQFSSNTSRMIPTTVLESEKLLQEYNLKDTIGITKQNCSLQFGCQILYIINFKKEIIGKYHLPIVSSRIRELIFKMMGKKDVKTESKMIGNKMIESVKENQISLKMDISFSKINNQNRKVYEDDWHRAKILTQNKIIIQKRTQQNKEKKDKQKQSKDDTKTNKDNLTTQKLSMNPEDYYGWYAVYLLLFIGLICGMCYLNREQKNQVQEPQLKTVHNEQTDKLASFD